MSPILFSEKGVFGQIEDNIHAFNNYLSHKEVWYIVDSREPMEYDAKTILICSPMKDHYRNFDKLIGTTIRYMPVWEWEEKANDPTQQNTLEDAIARCDEKIFNYIGESYSRDEVSHKLIHICTNPLIDESEDDGSDIEVESGEEVEYVNEEPYTLKTITFASDYVGEKVTEKLKISILDRLRTEFELSLTEEYNDHRALIQDIKKQNEILTFSAVRTIEDGKYYRPNNKNFPSIDAIIAPDMLFQVTNAINHPIKIIGLKKLISKLARTGEISFYFVVPAELYDRYQNQKFITTNNANTRRMPSWIKNRVKQYALRMDLFSESSSSGSSLKRKGSSLGGASSSKRVKK
ncbi:1248_t:CDS:2 [Acaulospora colombiana]|uniref:1248_t:CDS:1 n=1 Tax=Acaulospora colombiana TaxID=27376 RepID=A0ACA9M1C2_9GLOM|nr:1248_t:CDS:2 [Acaulospora colombiana]